MTAPACTSDRIVESLTTHLAAGCTTISARQLEQHKARLACAACEGKSPAEQRARADEWDDLYEPACDFDGDPLVPPAEWWRELRDESYGPVAGGPL